MKKSIIKNRADCCMANVPLYYGGQAVIEGVMMGGKYTTVTAVRRKDDSVTYFECRKRQYHSLRLLKKIPILRGIVAIFEASAIGTRHLNYASDVFEQEPSEDAALSNKPAKGLGAWIGLTALGILSFLFAKFVFTLVPAWVASLFEPWISGRTGQVLLEGFFKVMLLIGYIYFISLTPLMKRLFQYHGAEHKVINTFESGEALTVENVRKHSRFHYRCGSSFIIFTALISVFLYFFVPTDPLWLRFVTRILLIPLDLGLAFEILKFTNRVRHIPVLRWLGYPGLSVQLLTTKEPNDEQIEIGIKAFERMRVSEAAMEHEQIPEGQVL
jgi:Predicted metal-dependent enzyme